MRARSPAVTALLLRRKYVLWRCARCRPVAFDETNFDDSVLDMERVVVLSLVLFTELPSDAVVSAAASGASSAACAAARSSAALCLFSLGASAHSWCCKARRSPASRFALLLGGRAYANSSSASPALLQDTQLAQCPNPAVASQPCYTQPHESNGALYEDVAQTCAPAATSRPRVERAVVGGAPPLSAAQCAAGRRV